VPGKKLEKELSDLATKTWFLDGKVTDIRRTEDALTIEFEGETPEGIPYGEVEDIPISYQCQRDPDTGDWPEPEAKSFWAFAIEDQVLVEWNRVEGVEDWEDVPKKETCRVLGFTPGVPHLCDPVPPVVVLFGRTTGYVAFYNCLAGHCYVPPEYAYNPAVVLNTWSGGTGVTSWKYFKIKEDEEMGFIADVLRLDPSKVTELTFNAMLNQHDVIKIEDTPTTSIIGPIVPTTPWTYGNKLTGSCSSPPSTQKVTWTPHLHSGVSFNCTGSRLPEPDTTCWLTITEYPGSAKYMGWRDILPASWIMKFDEVEYAPDPAKIDEFYNYNTFEWRIGDAGAGWIDRQSCVVHAPASEDIPGWEMRYGYTYYICGSSFLPHKGKFNSLQRRYEDVVHRIMEARSFATSEWQIEEILCTGVEGDTNPPEGTGPGANETGIHFLDWNWDWFPQPGGQSFSSTIDTVVFDSNAADGYMILDKTNGTEGYIIGDRIAGDWLPLTEINFQVTGNPYYVFHDSCDSFNLTQWDSIADGTDPVFDGVNWTWIKPKRRMTWLYMEGAGHLINRRVYRNLQTGDEIVTIKDTAWRKLAGLSRIYTQQACWLSANGLSGVCIPASDWDVESEDDHGYRFTGSHDYNIGEEIRKFRRGGSNLQLTGRYDWSVLCAFKLLYTWTDTWYEYGEPEPAFSGTLVNILAASKPDNMTSISEWAEGRVHEDSAIWILEFLNKIMVENTVPNYDTMEKLLYNLGGVLRLYGVMED